MRMNKHLHDRTFYLGDIEQYPFPTVKIKILLPSLLRVSVSDFFTKKTEISR